MITPRQREREPYDEYSDHRRDRSPHDRDFYEERKERDAHIDRFVPRRGPAKITWPLAPERALRELTGRKSLTRALLAYVYFFNVRRAHWGNRLWSSDAIRKMVLDGPWTKEYFRMSAEEYLLYPRKGFNAAKQKERISKVFRKLGLK